MMRIFLFLLLLFASPATAQVVQPTPHWGMQISQNRAGLISPLADLIGQRVYCWACGPNIPGIGTSFYIPCCRDPLGTTNAATTSFPHDLAWYYNNHPDWLVYKRATVTMTIASPGVITWVGSDLDVNTVVSFETTGALPTGFSPRTNYFVVSQTTDTFRLSATRGGTTINTSGSQSGVHTGIATATGGSGNLWAVNISDPNVHAYMLAYAKNPQTVGGTSTAGGVLRGYDFLAIDNVAHFNSNNLKGYYAGAVAGCPSGPPGCGGVWTQRWTGADIDSVWAEDMYTYLGYLRTHLNRSKIGIWINAKNNHNDVSGAIKLANTADVVMRESQFLHACASGTTNTDFSDGIKSLTDWYAELQLMNAIWDKKPVVSFNYLCNHPLASATNKELEYAVGNFYLMRGVRTYFEMQNGTSTGTGDANRLVSYPVSIKFDPGTPVDAPPVAGPIFSGGPCPKREYTKAYVAVWPQATGSCVYTVPAGTWTDMFGNPVSSGAATLLPDASVTPNRANAVVLMR